MTTRLGQSATGSPARGAGLSGALVVDKPRGLTSHDVVAHVRKLLKIRTVGHLGTLDPIATGVLPLLVAAATRLQQFYGARRKEYRGRIRFGYATDTYDAEGHPLGEDTEPTLRRAELEAHARAFTGKLTQVPPPYSAKKVEGVAAYERARRREQFSLKPVAVEVYRFEIERVEGACAEVRIECAAGTYIRSLVHDLGQRLGCGAHLAEICRTASGEFRLEHTVSLEALEVAAREERLPQLIVPMGELLPDLPRAELSPLQERRVRHGNRIELSETQIRPGGTREPLDREVWKPFRVRLLDQNGELVAIAQAVTPRVFQPVVVLPRSA